MRLYNSLFALSLFSEVLAFWPAGSGRPGPDPGSDHPGQPHPPPIEPDPRPVGNPPAGIQVKPTPQGQPDWRPPYSSDRAFTAAVAPPIPSYHPEPVFPEPPHPSLHQWVSKPWTTPCPPTPTYTPPKPSPSPPPGPPALGDALVAAGCSKFLSFIQSDQAIWALYNSNRVRTIYAPSDASLPNSTFRLRRRDLTPAQQQQADLAADTEQTDMSTLRLIPGTVVTTNDDTANLGGDAQVVVSDARNSTGTVKIASGLGNLVTLTNSDLPYTGGLIHVTDGLLTNPQLLSDTARATGKTNQFTTLLKLGQTNASTLDYTPRITVFIPSDAAFAAAGGGFGTLPKATLQGHVVVSSGGLSQKVGYLPNLQNGQVLETTSGSSLTVSVRDENYYIGDAEIVQANLILPNGVAHVINKVLTPIVTAAAASTTGNYGVSVILAWGAAVAATVFISVV